jgi:alcohol dehydrogenase YqhD (iron-dependent ADH family)
MSSSETYKKAFEEPPSSKVSGTAETSSLVSPYMSYGLPYAEACAKHATETFKCSRVYIIASGTLSRETDRLENLITALKEKGVEVVGVKKGMRPHTPWSQIIEIADEARAGNADCIVTLGAGSLTDGAKIVVLVCIVALYCWAQLTFDRLLRMILPIPKTWRSIQLRRKHRRQV